MTATTPQAGPHRVPAGRVLIILAIVEALLWLSDRFQWFAFNRHKGYTVLIAVETSGLVLLLMFLWFLGPLVRRRRLTFRVRSMVLLCLAVAIPCSWWAIARSAAREQREAVKWIHEAGGDVRYDYDLPPGRVIIPRPSPPGPELLRALLGHDLFANVTVVHLDESQIGDAELGRLKGLPHLKQLWLSRTAVSDAGLEYLKGLTQLRELALRDTKVSDAGLEHLKGLTQFQHLTLDNTKVTDIGMQYLQGMTDLRGLSLNGTEVSDIGLEHLKGLSRLEFLFLRGTKVSDAGLKYIKGFTDLRRLFLEGTHVTAAGVKKLQEALPNCGISLDDSGRGLTPEALLRAW